MGWSVVPEQVVVAGGLQFGHVGEGAAADVLARDFGEKAFDEV